MRICGCGAVLFLLLGGFGLMSPAQTPAAPAEAANGIIRLDVVVTPKGKDKPVAEIPQQDFSVLDNGVARPIRSFRAVTGPNTPVKVLIVLDAVNIDFSHVSYTRQQLDTFLNGFGNHLPQPTAMAIVTDTGTQITPKYTTDGKELAQALDQQVIGLRELRRSAGFYGAEERLQISLNTLGQTLAQVSTDPERKFIIWITPGWPLLSGPAVDYSNKQLQDIFRQVISFSDAMRKANATMYVVDPIGAGESPLRTSYYQEFVKGIRKPSQAALGDLGAQVLAVQSGGRYLAGNNDIGMMLQRCYNDASAFYEIEYQATPADAPNEYHSIDVRVSQPGMEARTRQGYYSQP